MTYFYHNRIYVYLVIRLYFILLGCYSKSYNTASLDVIAWHWPEWDFQVYGWPSYTYAGGKKCTFMLHWASSWIVVICMDSLSFAIIKMFLLWKIHLMFLRWLLILHGFKIHKELSSDPSYASILLDSWQAFAYSDSTEHFTALWRSLIQWDDWNFSAKSLFSVPHTVSGYYLMFLEWIKIPLPHNRLSDIC